MDSPQSVVSPFKSSVSSEPQNQKSDFYSVGLSKTTESNGKDAQLSNLNGVLDVHIHHAREILNICIYHKQDVYAKCFLTSDPENTVSTKTINGGGQNPVFNDSVRLNVRTIESSLKCEIYMMSRVKNYLEDQLLGFALVPLSEVVVKNENLEKEFSLSTNDMFHSPAGFVQLSLAYSGASPDVMVIPVEHSNNEVMKDSEITDSFDKIEFPDPQMVNENEIMVSEYIGIQQDLNCESPESLVTSEAENHDATKLQNVDSPPSSVATNGISSAASDLSDGPAVSTTPSEELISSLKEKSNDAGEIESESSSGTPIGKPVVKVSNIVPEQNVVQQDIVDMYMKSMQQFTESLAKMKLPLDTDSGPTSSESFSSDQKVQPAKNPGNSRVFYGSRAFF
ncbi:hypothetical protein ACFE04_024320 [Oxalis oulophora]